MSLLNEINTLANNKQAEQLIAEGKQTACEKYFDPSRFDDFANAIAELVKSGESFYDAKAIVFDETNEPENGTACCKALKAAVEKIVGK